MTVIHTPPGFDRAALLGRLNSAALEHSAEYRRAITRTSPLLWACTYFYDWLHSDETGGAVSFSRMHVDMARAARRWVRDDIGPGEIREAWIAPRNSAKSLWTLMICMWAMAHRHPVGRFIHLFSDTDDQARKNLRSVRDELEHNELLRFDFPELCTLERGQDRADLFVTRSGAAMAAAGLSKSTLGVRLGKQRPTALVIDDPEPEAKDYEATTKDRRLSAIENKVLPMAVRAPVWWAGTTTVHGGLAHDLVRSALGIETAQWVRDMQVRARVYPAIEHDDQGRERSLWPQMWDLSWLQSIRRTRMYAMNYGLMPPDAAQGYWSPADIVVDPNARTGPRTLMVDPAVTTRGDFTGLAVVGREPAGERRVVIDYARGLKVSPEGLRRVVADIAGRNRTIRRIRVESNQGGELLLDVLGGVADELGVELQLFRTSEAKPVRLSRFLDAYQQRRVVHSRELPELTEQQLSYPNVVNDDVVDAACAGWECLAGEQRPTGRAR